MKSILAVSAVALALATTVARAEPGNPATGLFAQAAGLSNAFEIQESKIILEDSTNPALRSFAEAMVHDHGMAQMQLREAAMRAGVPADYVLDSIQQKKVDAIGLMDGATLDQTYVTDQIAAHATAAANLASYAAMGSDPVLRAYARQSLPVVLHHQHMLEELTGQPKMM